MFMKIIDWKHIYQRFNMWSSELEIDIKSV